MDLKNEILEMVKKAQDGIETTALKNIIIEHYGLTLQQIDNYIDTLIADEELLIQYSTEKKIKKYVVTEEQNRTLKSSFENLGAPQSNNALQSLLHLINTEKKNIIIVSDATSPTTYQGLQNRINNNLSTTILLPPKKEIPNEKHPQYTKIMKEWRKFYKENRNNKFLTILISRSINPSIRTGLLTTDYARINIRELDPQTTRNGNIIKVNSNTTLYYQFNSIVKKQTKKARKLWALNTIFYNIWHPYKFYITVTFFVLIISLGINIMINNKNSTFSLSISILLSLLTGIVSGILANKIGNTLDE